MNFTQEERRIYGIIRQNAPASVEQITVIVSHSDLDLKQDGVEEVIDDIADEDIVEQRDGEYQPTDPDFRIPHPGEKRL
ncbi:hypothetical protein HLRTI_000508 [Halorhabdus tiamatea SARL4B]|uniref:Uncharacterized protein n=1 Tax=Halorhabdus tiamatea SARL4B TaxID=1033806 RepID=F7PLR2_9EURY|nr:hypothetical protein [Halorhabdus tiamatea]ERJ07465.1 hypothetical protein HLRTI_000508 [Halorhabdus tiamatea SARL4B]